jgi:hypothetical protein
MLLLSKMEFIARTTHHERFMTKVVPLVTYIHQIVDLSFQGG